MITSRLGGWAPIAALILLLFASFGCARNPVSGRPELVLVSARSERRIGAEEAEKVARFMGLAGESQAVAWVEAVGARLAEKAQRKDVEYRFHVVDMVEPNAFALPGGYVYVTRGLLALVNSEDELACVLAHEVGHVEARHTVRRLTLAAPFAVATALPGFLVGIVSPALGQVAAAPGALAGGLVLSPYSRAQESQADEVGLALAARAGWDPEGLPRFLATLGREEMLHREKARRASFFDSHPGTPHRIRKTDALARNATLSEGRPIAGDRVAVLARLDGLRLGEDPANGVFSEGRFLHASLGFGVSFPKDWKTHNARNLVGASAPDGRGIAVLRVVGEGQDPMLAAREREAQPGTTWVEKAAAGRIAGLPAARAVVDVRLESGPGRALLTWVAHRDLLYELAGVTTRRRFDALRPTLEKVAASFAPLQGAERARIRDTRLRIVEALAGESLMALSKRTGSAWSLEETALANGLGSGVRLRSGQLVKIAIEEPWGGSRR